MYDELVKRLREAPYDWPDADLHYEAADAIESTNKAYQMMAEAYEAEVTKPRWIPVTERLPEDGVPVLACYIGYNSGLLRTDLLVCRHEDEWCYWHGETCSYNTCKVIITHWMPLPEPPKGET